MNRNDPFKTNTPSRIGIAFTVLEGFLSACSYMIIYVLINTLLQDEMDIVALNRLTAFTVILFAVRTAAYAFGYTQGQIGGGAISKRLRLVLGEKFRKIPLGRFHQGQVGQYVSTMTSDVSGYEQILTHKTGNIIKNASLSLMTTAFACYLYLPSGLVLIAASLLFIPNLWISFKVVGKYGTARNRLLADSVSGIVEYVTGIRTFRAYRMSGTKHAALTKTLKDLSHVSYRYEATGIPVAFFFNMLTWLSLPAVMLTASRPWLAGSMSDVNFLMLAMLPMMVSKLHMAISVDLFSYKNMMISKRKIETVLTEPEESGEDEAMDVSSWDVSFSDVRFSYVRGEPVLKGVSFTAADKKLTAIVGDSGSGKSTILNLIAKYYEPDEGRIFIGGAPIKDIAAEHVLQKISMVDQDVFLFDDTVRENIRHARPGASDEEIEAACRAANCESFIQKMEKGYDTPIGENGHLLSGGERGRLSIARAILKNSPILLLDEATASLDIENELAVKEAIANLLKQQKTVIMIAHTLSVIKNADQILVLSDGTVAESGTHEELLSMGGKYAAMWHAEQALSA